MSTPPTTNKTMPISDLAQATKEDATKAPVTTEAKTDAPAEASKEAPASEAAPEVKPEETKPETPTQAPKAPIAPAASVPAPKIAVATPENTSLLGMNHRIEEYKKINKGFLRDEKQIERAIYMFRSIIETALGDPSQAVLDRLYRFFKEDSSVILAPSLALQGLQGIPSATRAKIEIMYTMFFEMSRPKPGRLNFTEATKILGNETVTAYVRDKLKKLSAAAAQG